jgi:hypothetical protein
MSLRKQSTFLILFFISQFLSGQDFLPGKIEVIPNVIDHTFIGSKISEDDLGFLWHVSTKGIYRYDGYEFQLMSPHAFKNNAFFKSDIFAFLKIGKNRFAAYSRIGIIKVIDLNTNELLEFDLFPGNLKQAENKSTRRIYYDDNVIWVACAYGLRKLDLRNNELKNYPFDPDLQIGGLWTKDKNLFWTIVQNPNQVDELIIGGQLGIYFFNKQTNKFTKREATEKGVLNLFTSNGNKLFGWQWENGLFTYDFDAEKVEYLKQKEESKYLTTYEYNDSCLIMIDDKKGFTWLNRNTMERVHPDDSKVYFETTGHGLSNLSFTDSRGNFWLSSQTNIFKIHPSKIDSSIAPKIAVTKLKSEDFEKRLIYDYKQIDLPISNSNIDINFAAVNPLLPADIKYAYRLNNSKWIQLGKSRSLRLNNLSNGNYNLEIKANNPKTFGSIEQEVLNFSVNIPFHQRAIFLPLLFGLGLLILGSFAFLYIKQLKSANQLNKAQFQMAELELHALRSQMNPHFMFNSLNSIKYFILQSKPETAAEYLSDFAHLIRMILQHSRKSNITLSEELEVLELYIELEQLRFGEAFEFSKIIDPSVELEFVKIPPMLLQPYVENAIWHGLNHSKSKGSLILEIRKTDDFILCIIDDNGIGRTKSASLKSLNATKYKSMGMGITQNRIDLINKLNQMGIAVEIIDKKDQDGSALGTKVVLKIPHNQE